MASITGKSNLFFVTSPRSPYKMKDEVAILTEDFNGEKWTANPELQQQFYKRLAKSEDFVGSLSGDLAFKARDRITRGPKALGLVDLDPVISLTDAGNSYIFGQRSHEIFTRQLLKFQFPSPYHIDKNDEFFIRPYLELFRLVYELGDLSKDEIAAFVIQLIHIDKYEDVKTKILQFRKKKRNLDRKHTNYNRFFDEVFTQEIVQTYSRQLSKGDIKTRESAEKSRKKFIKTKKANHKDYADAAIRYLRETKLVSLKSSRSNKVYIPADKADEVKFILENTLRQPLFTQDKKAFKEYLFDSQIPPLLTDDKNLLASAIQRLSGGQPTQHLANLTIEELKDLKDRLTQEKLDKILEEQINNLQLYGDYENIIDLFNDIRSKSVIDAPLFMEWNTWRSFVMLNDGEIIGNFRLDDTGLPLSIAPGNQADILCKYEGFDVLVEVTLATGATQYKMEGEPVARHLGNHNKSTKKDCYCIFIASSIHEATLAHFFGLHKISISYYGGTSKIIPIKLSDFELMLKKANEQKYKPNADDIKAFVQKASDIALTSTDENEWYQNLKLLITNWI